MNWPSRCPTSRSKSDGINVVFDNTYAGEGEIPNPAHSSPTFTNFGFSELQKKINFEPKAHHVPLPFSRKLMTTNLIEKITIFARKHSLPPEIVYGVCVQESRLIPIAARFEPGYRWLYKVEEVCPPLCSKATEKNLQMTSFGLMQVMGAVYREYGYKGWLTALFNDTESQLEYGCRHLARKVKKYGLNEGILAYNAGSPRKNASGRYVNEDYLKNILRHSLSFKN